MSDLDMFAARTQSRITFTLIGGFLGLMFALLIVACLPLQINDKLLSVLDRIVTAMLPIVGGAVGFWTARHRAPTEDDPPIVSREVTATSTVVSQSVPLAPTQPQETKP